MDMTDPGWAGHDDNARAPSRGPVSLYTRRGGGLCKAEVGWRFRHRSGVIGRGKEAQAMSSAASAPERLLTAEEYLLLPDDGIPNELVRGRVVEVGVPTPRHGEI